MKNKNRNKRSGRRKTNRGSEVSKSSSAVGSVKNTTEEVTVVNSERKWNEGRGSWRKGNGRGLECPLTPTPPLMTASTRSRPVQVGREFGRK